MSEKQLLMKVPTSIARKFKVVASSQGRSMTDLFVEFVNTLEPLNIPKPEMQKSHESQKTTTIKNHVDGDYRLVDIKQISDKQAPRPLKVNKAIKDLAESIVKIGLIRPLMLLKLGTDNYQLLSDEAEFQAVRQANKLNPKNCEMINAFIVPKDAIGDVFRQIEILDKLN
ncbi:MAG: hypothetical protein HQM08_25925 [Candidatus Riflebacteria bacterium]|nr:hypothetical protein [Candidatus Riflebacteria bacterium]